MTKERILKAKYKGILPIGGVELSCAVLDDGTRVLPRSSVFTAFERQKRGLSKERKELAQIETDSGVLQLPAFVAASNLKQFIGQDLIGVLSPVAYKDGTRKMSGYKAEILPELCKLYLDARRAGVLTPQQESLAIQAEILLSSFAKIGIAALIDEATGFQHDREYNALRLLLQQYIDDELRKWVKRFPDQFFSQLDRLYENPTLTPRKRPQYYGKFINTYVYKPIESGYVKQELDKLNITDSGKRKARFHQWLSEFGVGQLTIQIGRVMGVMEISANLRKFKDNIARQSGLSPIIQLRLFEDPDDN